jgi:hypothetical protein
VKKAIKVVEGRAVIFVAPKLPLRARDEEWK